jgi:hypothetical protein
MALTSFDPRGPYVVPGRNGGIPSIQYGLLEADSETFKAGQFVYLVSAAVTLYPGGDIPLYGIAMKDATNVTSLNTEIPVMIITSDDEIAINVATSADVPEAANTTCAVGTDYDTNTGASYPSYIDSADTTNPLFVFQGEMKDADGTASTRGIFRLIPAECQAWGN